MWDCSHVEFGSLVSFLLRKRDFALGIGYIIPGMWFLRRHTVYFSFWLHHFRLILIGNTTSKARFIMRPGLGGCETFPALEVGVGAETILVKPERLQSGFGQRGV